MVAMGERFNHETAYADAFPWSSTALEMLALQLIASPDALVLVAERDGVLIGMLGAMAFQHPMSGEYTVSEMFWWMQPEHRGQGLRLMRAAEVWAKDRGAVRMLMIAPTESVGKLYQRLGYAALETSYQRSL